MMEWIPCHRRVDRSFHVCGKKMPLCARCTSILAGYVFAPIATIMAITAPLLVILILCFPVIIDGYTQKWKWRTSNNLLRFLTGLSFGIGQSLLISKAVWYLVSAI